MAAADHRFGFGDPRVSRGIVIPLFVKRFVSSSIAPKVGLKQ
jgi:hypothetical protein